MTKRPHGLDEYIARAHRSITEGNEGDNRPTYQSELDAVTSDSDKYHERGLQLIETISSEDRQRCRRLYLHKHGNSYGIDTLIKTILRNKMVVVPAHIALIEEVGTLQNVLR